MHLLSQEEYGLRCLLQVAGHGGPDPLTIPEIAGAEGLSPEYTAKLMRALRRGGLVTSTRGASGGYRLARPANELTPWEVLQVLGGTFFPDSFCEAHPGQRSNCVHNSDCAVRSLWRRAETVVRDLMQSVTLADLLGNERAVLISLDERAGLGLAAEAPDG